VNVNVKDAKCVRSFRNGCKESSRLLFALQFSVSLNSRRAQRSDGKEEEDENFPNHINLTFMRRSLNINMKIE